jgi:hypothetical protein
LYSLLWRWWMTARRMATKCYWPIRNVTQNMRVHGNCLPTSLPPKSWV